VSTTEELLERKSSGSGLESLEYGRGDPPLLTGGTKLVAYAYDSRSGIDKCGQYGKYKFATPEAWERVI
jgi:hypothetical protein